MANNGSQPNMKKRLRVLAALLLAFGFVLVAVRLFYMQVIKYNFFQQQATSMQTRDTLITPKRGTIYDCNMQTLAESASTTQVNVNPSNVQEKNREALAKILSEQLDVNYEAVLQKVSREDSMYEIIKTQVEQDQLDALLAALEAGNCSGGVETVADTKRYYKYGKYLSSVLGYVNGDGNGVIGIEAQYESELAGTAGRLVRAQNAQNQDMPYEYEQELAATDGNSVMLTVDSEIQSYLEKHLETALADNPAARDGVAGVVMNVKTGEILAMASLPDFDPNEPRVISNDLYLGELKTTVSGILADAGISTAIDDKYYQQGGLDNLPESIQKNDSLVSDLTTARLDILNKMWRNTSIQDTYEPGSTFKLLNLATAYEVGAVHDGDHFNCEGSLMVGDWTQPIKCWKSGGHGDETLVETLMNSCNVAMMQMAFATGQDTFYEYVKAFGMLDKTGIDLPSESQGLFHDPDNPGDWNIVSLAVSSFGQRFTVTPIQMLNMVCAVVDDGKLKIPYTVKQVIAADGTVKSTTEPTVVRQVISADTSAFMRNAMEQVVENGTGKNAYVAGYRVGGKTATSELQKQANDNEDRYAASFIGVAPMDDPQIAVIVLINDLPESATHGGGAIAAPVVGRIMEDVLPYIGVTPSYSESEDDRRELTVPNVIGATEEQAAATLQAAGLTYRTVGEGGSVTDQVPANGVKIPATGSVILYMGESKPTEQIEVPDLLGLSPNECQEQLAEQGLYIKRKGVATSQTTGETAAEKQNPVAGTKVNIGSVITVEFANSSNIGD